MRTDACSHWGLRGQLNVSLFLKKTFLSLCIYVLDQGLHLISHKLFGQKDKRVNNKQYITRTEYS